MDKNRMLLCTKLVIVAATLSITILGIVWYLLDYFYVYHFLTPSQILGTVIIFVVCVSGGAIAEEKIIRERYKLVELETYE